MASRVARLVVVCTILIASFLVAFSGRVAAANFAVGDYVVVNTDALNLRSEPGLDAQIILELPFAAEMTLIGGPSAADGHTWFQVDLTVGPGVDPIVGWVAEDFLAYWPDRGDADWVIAKGMRVFDGPVNVREGPRLNEPVIATLETGAERPVSYYHSTRPGDGYHWFSVTVDSTGTWGWVAIEFLEPLNYFPNLPNSGGSIWDFEGVDSAWVSDGPVNFRSEPSTGADILFTLGNSYYVFGVEIVYAGDEPLWSDGHYWVYATAGGYEGFLAATFLTPAD